MKKFIYVYGKKIFIKEILKKNDHFDPKTDDGSYDSANSTIYINKSLNDQEKIQTFMHELCHAVLDRMGCSVEVISEALEEILVELISVGIFEVMDVKFKK